MRQLSDNFIQANLSLSREPTLVIKIINENKNIYLTHGTVAITDAGADFLPNSVISCGGSSQSIVPERGYSTIGNISFSFLDLGFTEILRGLKDTYNDSIINNKVEIYTGFADLAFADYALVIPMYVSQVDNDEQAFTIALSDTQRFVKKSIFSELKTTTAISSLGVATGSLEVISSDGFEAVYHDSGWGDAPSSTVGYLSVSGTDAAGSDVTEIMRWTSKADSTHFTIDKRGVAGSRIVNIVGTIDGGNYEIAEMVYLDLSVPKMIIALQTGDLYGDVGQTLPDAWHAGVTSNLIDLASYEEIGDDLWSFRLEFWGISGEDAKGFIAEQCMAPLNLFNYINQNGELTLKRFSYISPDSAGDLTLDYDSLTSVSGIVRDAKAIRNVFSINWEWHHQDDTYFRTDTFVDSSSVALNNFISDAYSVNLKGIRNRNRESGLAVNQLAEGIRARFSAPKVTPTVKAFLRDTIELEIGDLVTLDLPNQPDYASLDTLRASFEVQGISWDFMTGETTLKLFGSSGKADPLELTAGVDALTFNRTGWTPLAGYLGITPTDGVLIINVDKDIANGKYYFDGDIRVNGGVTVTINQSVRIDCVNFEILTGGKIDGSGRGVVDGQGIYGGEGSSQEGMFSKQVFLQGRYVKRRAAGEGRTNVAAINAAGPPVLKPEITKAGYITGIGDILYGNGGGHGGGLDFQQFGGDIYRNGGSPVAGGAGLMIIATNMFFTDPSCIDLSGSANNVGSSYTDSGDRYASGSGGYGWPGVFYFLSKDRTAPLPNLSGTGGAIRAFTGAFSEIRTPDYRPFADGRASYSDGREPIGPVLPNGVGNANRNMNGTVSMSLRLTQVSDFVPNVAKDQIDTALTPSVTITELINTPLTPLGNQSTITITGTPQAGDESYLYTLFEYRAAGQTQWIPIQYDIRTEATVTVASDGSTYEIQSTAINLRNQRGGSVVSSVTVLNVSRDIIVYEAPKPITVPPIRRLELINRVDNDENWNKFKSSDAEFKWAKTSVTSGGNIINTSGRTDLHLTGYKVRVLKSDGKILREESVTDSYYVYTLEKNKKDNSGSPVREFAIDVQPTSSTGFTVIPTSIAVSNPAPAAPADVTSSTGLGVINISFTLPTDADFVGVDSFLLAGTGDPYADGTVNRVAGNTIALSGLSYGATYTIGLRSVDRFGTGGQVAAFGLVTTAIEALDVGGLGDWATRIDPVDTAFINANMEGESISGALLAAGGVTNEKLADLAVDAAKLANGSVLTGKLGDLSVDAAKLANGAVLTGKLGDLAVEAAKLADSAVTATKIANLAVGTAAIADAAITSAKIEDLAVGTAAIADAAIDSAKIANLAVGTAAIQDLAVSDAKIGSMTAGKITAGDITVTVGVGTGVNLNGADGTVTTANSGYTVTMGAVDVPAESSDPLILFSNDGTIYPFWVDATGAGKFGRLALSSNGSITSPGFSIDGVSGDATFSGALSAATGSFTGVVTVQAGSNVAIGADVTKAALEASTTMGAGTLHLNGTTANIAIGAATTWASDGIQLQYNSGTPRAHIGSTTNYVRYDGTNLVIAADAIGAGATIGTNSVAFGANAVASAASTVAIGVSANTIYDSNVVIGKSASIIKATNDANLGKESVAIGSYAEVGGIRGVAIGYSATVNAFRGIAIGSRSEATGSYTTALGDDAAATKSTATAIGSSAWSNHPYSVALGYLATTTADHQIMLGTSAEDVKVPGLLEVDGAIYEAGTNLSAKYGPITRTYIEVGAYAFLKSTSGGTPAYTNQSYAGSTLRFSDANNDNGGVVSVGTWLCCGYGTYKDRATLYQRIA